MSDQAGHKRRASEGEGAVSAGRKSKLPKVKEGEEEIEEVPTMSLPHQVKALAVEMHEKRRRINILKERTKYMRQRGRKSEAILSCFHRQWCQLELDLGYILKSLRKTSGENHDGETSNNAIGEGKADRSGQSSQEQKKEVDGGSVCEEDDFSRRLDQIWEAELPFSYLDTTLEPIEDEEWFERLPLDDSENAEEEEEEKAQNDVAEVDNVEAFLAKADMTVLEQSLKDKVLQRRKFTIELLNGLLEEIITRRNVKGDFSGQETEVQQLSFALIESQRERKRAIGQLLSLKEKLAFASRRVKELQAEIALKDLQRHRVCRELDRIKEGTDGRGGEASIDYAITKENLTRRSKESGKSENGPDQTSGDKDGSSKALVEELKSLSARRFQEIQRLREEKNKLNDEITRLRVYGVVPDVTISPAYVEVHNLYQQERTARVNAEGQRKRLASEVAELNTRLNEAAQKRAETDSFVKAKLESLAQKKERRIAEQKKEIDKLKDQLQAVVQQVTESNAARGQAEELRAFNNNLMAEMERMKKELARLRQEQTMQVERTLREEKYKLEREFEEKRAKWEAEGKQLSPEQAAESVSLAVLRKELEQAKAEIGILKDETEAVKAESDEFIAEIEQTVATYDKLTAQHRRLLQQLEEKDTANAQLVSEHLALTQTKTVLKEQAESYKRKLDSMNSQLEHERQLKANLEESLKRRAETVEVLERQYEELTRLQEKQQKLLGDSQKSLRVMTAQLEETNTKLQENLRRTDEKVREAEDHAHKCERLEEELERRKSRKRRRDVEEGDEGRDNSDEDETAEQFSRGNRSSGERDRTAASPRRGSSSREKSEEDMLKDEELKELRKMVRCSVCQDRTKSVVLIKCGHVFCKECIDENLRVRSRKCPGCGKMFGADDVRSFWMT